MGATSYVLLFCFVAAAYGSPLQGQAHNVARRQSGGADVEMIDTTKTKQEPEEPTPTSGLPTFPSRVPTYPGSRPPFFNRPVFPPPPFFDDDSDSDEEGYPFFDFPRPSIGFGSDWYRNLQAQLHDLQMQIYQYFRRNSTFGNLPPNYDNATYETKNINGTLVTINETIHKHGDKDNSFIFHTKVINFMPNKTKSGAGDDGLFVLSEHEGQGADFPERPDSRVTEKEASGTSEVTLAAEAASTAASAATTEVDQSVNDVAARRFRRSDAEAAGAVPKTLHDDIPKDVQ